MYYYLLTIHWFKIMHSRSKANIWTWISPGRIQKWNLKGLMTSHPVTLQPSVTASSVCPFTWLLLTIRHIYHCCILLYFLSVFSLDFFLLHTWPVRIYAFTSWFYYITKMKTNSSSTALTFSRPTAKVSCK